MAVTFYYPKPHMFTGKFFVSEIIGGFTGQRKEDHRLAIKRNLAALDTKELGRIYVESKRNTKNLTLELARAERGEIESVGRLEIARTKAEGAIMVQQIAAARGLQEEVIKAVADLYEAGIDARAKFWNKNSPEPIYLQQALSQVGNVDNSALYTAGIQGQLLKPDLRNNPIKQRLFLINAYNAAKASGHTRSAEAIRREFGRDAPEILENDPMSAFLRQFPEATQEGIDPIIQKLVGMGGISRAQAPVVRQVVQQAMNRTQPIDSEGNLVGGGLTQTGGGRPAYSSGIAALKEMLQQAKIDEAEAGQEYREARAEKKNFLTGSMSNWMAPTFTKSPEWEEDYAKLGAIGMEMEPTRFEHLMERVYAADGDAEEISKRYWAEEISPEGGSVPFPLYPEPGERGAIEALFRKTEEMEGFGEGDNGTIDRITAMYSAVTQNPEPYGDTGRALIAAVENAYQSKNMEDLFESVISIVSQGRAASLEPSPEEEKVTHRAAVEMERESASTGEFPGRDLTNEELNEISNLSIAELVPRAEEWSKRQNALLANLNRTAEENQEYGRLSEMNKWLAGPDGRSGLLALRQAEEAQEEEQRGFKGASLFRFDSQLKELSNSITEKNAAAEQPDIDDSALQGLINEIAELESARSALQYEREGVQSEAKAEFEGLGKSGVAAAKGAGHDSMEAWSESVMGSRPVPDWGAMPGQGSTKRFPGAEATIFSFDRKIQEHKESIAKKRALSQQGGEVLDDQTRTRLLNEIQEMESGLSVLEADRSDFLREFGTNPRRITKGPVPADMPIQFGDPPPQEPAPFILMDPDKPRDIYKITPDPSGEISIRVVSADWAKKGMDLNPEEQAHMKDVLGVYTAEDAQKAQDAQIAKSP